VMADEDIEILDEIALPKRAYCCPRRCPVAG
jgi:hypothetical protein